MAEELDPVWKALSSPLRRHMLTLLRNGPLTTGEISDAFPDLSRFAVMQHLGVLETARLVLVRREGRKRLNFLNALPLRHIYEFWVTDHADFAAKTSMDLKRFTERKETAERMQTGADKIVKIEQEIELAAPQEKVFRAICEEMNDWWPHRFKEGGIVRVEPRIGGLIWEDWGNGNGAQYGTIVWLEPPYKFASTSPSAMNKGYMSFNVETVEPTEAGCLYKKSLTLWGDVPPELKEMFERGAASIVKKALKEYVEEGIRYGQ